MDVVQIVCTPKDVTSFLGVFPSDILTPPSVTVAANLIVYTDPHTSQGSHWLAISLQPRSYSGHFFDSYGLPPLIPNITDFLIRTCTVWDYNPTQMQGLTSSVCGKYCCLFAVYMDRGTVQNASWSSSIPPSQTGRSNASSCRNSARYPRGLFAGVSAASL
jgi:hypothetical protein